MAAPPRLALFSALSHRPFAMVWGGQVVSSVGDGVHAVAVAWWVVAATGSAAAMGAVLAAAAVPELLLLLLGGVAVDRMPRLRAMLAADLLRATVMAGVGLLAWQDRLAVSHLLAAGVLFGAASALFYPASAAVMPDLLPSAALPSGNALRGLALRFGAIAGPALGGALVARGGGPLAFVLDGASFLVSAACVAAAGRLSPARTATTTGALVALREGFATVVAAPWLWITIVVAGVSNVTLAGPLYAALPLLVADDLGGDAGALGRLDALAAAGAVGAALWLGRLPRIRRRGKIAYGCWLAAALAAAAVGLPLSPVGVGVAMLAYGAAEAGLGLVWANALQELVPGERLGRVASIDALGSAALLPVGFALSGAAADRFGAAPVFVAGGLISAGVIALGLAHPAIRGLD